jgi:hypothetical protein
MVKNRVEVLIEEHGHFNLFFVFRKGDQNFIVYLNLNQNSISPIFSEVVLKKVQTVNV